MFRFVFALSALVAATTPAALAATIQLKEAIAEALHSSPVVQRSEAALDESRWRRVESYSGFLPTLSASYNYLLAKKYVFTDINFGATPVSVPGIIPTSNLTLTGTLPLFDGLASTHRYWSAQGLERASENDLEWTRFQTEREVILAYYRALSAKVLREVADQNLKTLLDHQRDVQLFKKAGISTNFDILRVDVQVSEARSEVMNAADNEVIARNRLAETLGREPEVFADRELQGQLPVLPPDLLAHATDLNQYAGRKDLAALQLRSESLSDQEASASRYWVPRVALFGQYQLYNNRNDEAFATDPYRGAYNVGLSLNWNLFDGMASIARSRESVAARAQAERGLDSARLHARQDLETWKRKFAYFGSVYRSRVEDVQKSTESVRLAREGTRVGSRTNTDMLDAEGELFRARAGAINSQIGAIEALINLELASGKKLYDFN